MTPKTPNLPSQVKSILRSHRGRANPITGRELAGLLGQRDDRQVRLAIRQLIAAGEPIASATESPPGYYLVQTPTEAREYMAELRGRLKEDALRRRDFRRAAGFYLDRVTQGRLIV